MGAREAVFFLKSPVVETKDRRRSGFPFRSDQLSLDFVATVAKRDMGDIERLVTGDDLQTWLYVAGLPPAVGMVTDSQLGSARKLREAINHLTRSRVDGRHPDPGSIDVINRAATFGPPHATLSADGTTAVPAHPAPVEQILSTIARDAIDLFSGDYRDRVRRCLGHDCSLYFVDRSRKGIRRWCSMAACGERASSAAYRRRHGGSALRQSL
ncbi:CGNR zinc finger domain-containing protein [Rhodococcus sp. NPDC127530]|uniref:CGNR zinc finger domain-containing protein n=1 Tax=unclassified Rhodococcus (in: high G+C Gram-positive bacteria) TaxID=192944 RepID=UPI00362D574E